MKISTRELRANLGEYLRLAQEGAEVLIMRHGKDVARLVACDDTPFPNPPVHLMQP